jgi:AcrR family transcriptional regulator
MTRKVQLKPRKIPAQERSRFTVKMIYEAAAQVFSKEGYEGTTTDLIAEKAGVSIGTLYQYFVSKDAILYGLFEQHMKDVMDAVRQIQETIRQSENVGPDMTREIIRMVLDHNVHDRAQHTLFIGNIGWPDEIVQKQLDMGRTLKTHIEEIFRSLPNIRVKDHKTAAHVIWSTIRMTIHDYLLYWSSDIPSEALISELSDMINRYLFGSSLN